MTRLEPTGAVVVRPPNRSLVGALRRVHRNAAAGLLAGDPYDRRLAPLRYLAPDLQTKVLAGDHRFDMTLEEVIAIAAEPLWETQRRQWSVI